MNDPTGLRTMGRVMAGIRVAGGARQIDLAKRLGVSDDRVSRIENDTSPLPMPMFIRWCRESGADPAVVIQQLPEYEAAPA